eukprot:COSAG02_NODE_2430_length_8883_cov_3.641621_3_plen_227_part_00
MAKWLLTLCVLVSRPSLVNGEQWVPVLKFNKYGKPKNCDTWTYTDGSRKRNLSGQSCSQWKLDWAVPMDIDAILDVKVGFRKGQRIQGSARGSVSNLRVTGELFVFMQPDLSSVVISFYKPPEVTWDFTVEIGTRHHAIVVAGQAAQNAAHAAVGDNMIGEVAGVVVGAAAGVVGAGVAGVAGVGKVFQGIAGKKKQAAKEAKAQSMDDMDVSIEPSLHRHPSCHS